MKRLLVLTMVLALAVVFTPKVFAQGSATVSTDLTLGTLNSFVVGVSEILSNGSGDPLAHTWVTPADTTPPYGMSFTMDFDDTADPITGKIPYIWRGTNYFAVDIGVINNDPATTWGVTINTTSGGTAAPITGPGGYDISGNVNVTIARTVTNPAYVDEITTPGVPPTFDRGPAGSADPDATHSWTTADGVTWNETDLAGGWMRLYIGIAHGAPAGASGSALDNDDVRSGSNQGVLLGETPTGTYSGTLVVTYWAS